MDRIDKLIVKMDFGLESHIYHFVPRTANNEVILYHQGHAGDFYHSKKQIATFLDHGYAVVAFCMPLVGLNNRPTVVLPRFGRLDLTSHEQIKFLLPAHGHPIKYFVEPTVVALNYLERDYDYALVAMVGLSGGGWTTACAAAVEPRIKKSFHVAGSYPIYLRSGAPGDWGDWEQTEPSLYSTANYLEMYVLGAYGPGRKQVQVINRYDPCCFSGDKRQTYEDIVQGRVGELGMGEFELFSDDTHNSHTISKAAMERILQELED